MTDKIKMTRAAAEWLWERYGHTKGTPVRSRPWWKVVNGDTPWPHLERQGWSARHGTPLRHEITGNLEQELSDLDEGGMAPPPCVGQVWHFPHPDPDLGGVEFTIVSIDLLDDAAYFAGPDSLLLNHPAFEPTEEEGDTLGVCAQWPPKGGLLVSGPHSPWAPESYEVIYGDWD